MAPPKFAYWATENLCPPASFVLVDACALSVQQTKWMVLGAALQVHPMRDASIRLRADAVRLHVDGAIHQLQSAGDHFLQSDNLSAVEIEVPSSSDEVVDRLMAPVGQFLAKADFSCVAREHRYLPGASETIRLNGELVDRPIKSGARMIYYRPEKKSIENFEALLKRLIVLELYGQREAARTLVGQYSALLPNALSLSSALSLLTDEMLQSHAAPHPASQRPSRFLRALSIYSSLFFS